MKSKIPMVLALMLLSGCGTMKQWPAPVESAHGSVAPRPDKTRILFDEANQLADQVKNGELTRLQAADRLNQLRLRLVGPNKVDDATFATYRYLAAQRDAGAITSQASQSRMEMTLRDWQQRWPLLARHPADPAFTNFLLQLYGLPQLGPLSP
jgi:hypothetical protein